VTKAGYGAVVVVLLLIAGFRYAGWSLGVLAALLAFIWIVFSVGISFVRDRRYTRAFAAPVDRLSKGSIDHPRLSIGRATLIGGLVVNLPAIGLFAGLIVPVASALQQATGYDGIGHAPALPSIVAVAVGFVASWMWWAIAAPRWLLWAMKRVVDPIALRNAVVGSIIWPNNRWGRALNNTQWRSAAIEKEEQEIVQEFVRRIGPSQQAQPQSP
jgi:hypothetical protein